MPNFNQVIMVGHLTKDPELSFTQSNTPMCKGGIAVSEKWRDKDGGTKEKVCFLDFIVWGKAAEVFKKYTVKGQAIMLVGRLNFEQWDDKTTGAKRSKHTMTVEEFQFLSRPTEHAAPPADAGPPAYDNVPPY